METNETVAIAHEGTEEPKREYEEHGMTEQSRRDARVPVIDQILDRLHASRDALHEASELVDDERDAGVAGDLDALVLHSVEGHLNDSLLAMNAAVRALEDHAAHLDPAARVSRMLREARDHGWSDEQCASAAQDLVTRTESASVTARVEEIPSPGSVS